MKNLVWLLAVVLTACSSVKKIESLKPEPDDAAPLIYDTEPSFINMPVEISIQDIENQINKTLNGVIYEDKDITDDDIKLTVWKQAPIQLRSEGGKMKVILPLKAKIFYRYGTSKLGIDLYDTREFDLNGVVSLLSEVNLLNWKLQTKTRISDLDWKESPSMTLGSKAVSITYLVDPAIKYFKGKIEKNIDDAIKKTVDFKPQVLDALAKMSEPSLASETYQSWVRFTPIEVYATDATIGKSTLVMDMGVKCKIETLVGAKPKSLFNRDAVVLKAVKSVPHAVNAKVIAVSTYADAEAIITKNFAGQEFASGSRKVKVEQVKLWHKSGKIVVALTLSGSLNGDIYLSGFPAYNAQTKEIYFDNLDYVLDTKSTLIKAANWLASGTILKKMQQACRYSIAPNLEEGKKQLQRYTSNYSVMPGVFVNGTMNDVVFDKIQVNNKAILAFLEVSGKVTVKVDGFK